MNRKSNFLISISEKETSLENSKYPELPFFQEFEIRSYKISIRYSENASIAKSTDGNIIILFAGNIYQDDLSNYPTIEKY